jgi:uncharacterized membrane protein
MVVYEGTIDFNIDNGEILTCTPNFASYECVVMFGITPLEALTWSAQLQEVDLQHFVWSILEYQMVDMTQVKEHKA